MGSTAGVDVLEKREIPCPSGNELQLADCDLVTTDSPSTLPNHRLGRTFFQSDKNAENRAKFVCSQINY